MTRRKHYQMIKAQQEQLGDEISSLSSPSFNEFRLVCCFHCFFLLSFSLKKKKKKKKKKKSLNIRMMMVQQ